MENHEPGTENNTSVENLDHLVKDIESTLEFVKSSKLPAAQHCIIRSVNPLLRRVNEAAYRPLFVLIGPLRCYTSLLEPMELQKRIYLASFLQRRRIGASLNEFCKPIKDSSPEIRSRYEEPYYRRCDFKAHQIQQNIPPSDDNLRWFIEMVLADAAFIIELFLRIYHKEGRPESETDFVFDSPGKIYDIRRDLFLAHNQLPLFVLKQIYHRAFGNNPDHPSFIHLSCNFFYPYFNQNISIHDLFQQNQSHGDFIAKLDGAKHFTDLLRTLQLQHSFDSPGSNGTQAQMVFIAFIVPKDRGQPGSRVGVGFKSTEPFFRNIMGWEQSYYPEETLVCDYVFLMEYLIKSSDDVDLLVRKRIIINQLGSHTAVVTLFNDLCKHIPPAENNRYSETFRDLNAYNSVRCHGWMAKLRLLYFSSLCRSVATLAATALLLLTLTQTISAPPRAFPAASSASIPSTCKFQQLPALPAALPRPHSNSFQQASTAHLISPKTAAVIGG
ncbi:Detected protein of unknown function [Hibiscus syriacus]|uniref:Uncharacterized protein n=1 Tax=Hibiscus syriacus TaxID=106335 RepID=A0A6A3CWA0_HIBSY|nr:Detected protein of unknown function [Hibiscus syriacus]